MANAQGQKFLEQIVKASENAEIQAAFKGDDRSREEVASRGIILLSQSLAQCVLPAVSSLALAAMLVEGELTMDTIDQGDCLIHTLYRGGLRIGTVELYAANKASGNVGGGVRCTVNEAVFPSTKSPTDN